MEDRVERLPESERSTVESTRRRGPGTLVWVLLAIALLLVGAIAVVAVVGSGASPAASPAATASTPSPTPSITPERIVTQPDVRIPLGCDDLATDVAGFFDGQVPAVAATVPRVEGNASWVPGPAQYAFAQAGGLACEYGTIEGAWASVLIVPDAAGAIEDRDATLGPSACNGGEPCELVNGVYVEVEGQSVESPDDNDLRLELTSAAATSIRARVAAAVISPDEWMPPMGSNPITGDCEQLISPGTVGEIFDVTGVEALKPEGGWSIHAWLLFSHWDATPCYFSSGDSPDNATYYGDLAWLPGGEWAYRQAAPGDTLVVDGLQEYDEARISCGTVEWFSCVLDLLVDGNWVRYSLPLEIAADERTTLLTDIATEIVASVHAPS